MKSETTKVKIVYYSFSKFKIAAFWNKTKIMISKNTEAQLDESKVELTHK